MGWNNDYPGQPQYHTTGVQSYYCSQIFGDIVKLAEQGTTPEHFNFGAYSLGTNNTAVTHLTGFCNPAGGVQLSWQSSMANQVQFVITRTDKTPAQSTPGTNSTGNITPGSQGPTRLVETSSLTFTDTTAQPGNTYVYTVQAVDSSGQTVGSPASVTVAVPGGNRETGEPTLRATKRSQALARTTGNTTAPGNGTGQGAGNTAGNHGWHTTGNTDWNYVRITRE